MKEKVIETKQITKSYGSLLALDGVSLHVKRGEIYGLIGDNGAGKTTLLKTLSGLIWATKGDVYLFGQHEEKNLQECRKQIGTMIDEAGFFPYLSVEKNVEYYRILKGIPGKEKTKHILQLVGLWEKRKSKGKELSMGLKQRLGLAIAMIGEPQILILDEPINGLDPSGIIEFRNILLRLNQEKNITILLSSHILSELEQTATIFGFMSNGKLIEEIGIQKLKEKCADFIEITVSDVDIYSALLDRFLPQENYKILPQKSIRIFNPQKNIESFSSLAAKHDVAIIGLERHKYSLEEYYMNLKEGDRNA